MTKNATERLQYFITITKLIAPDSLPAILERYDNLSAYKAECANIIYNLTEEVNKTKDKDIALCLKQANFVYKEMGSRLRALTTLISTEKALLNLNPPRK